MTYQQTLDYLFTQLPMYQRVGAAAFKKDLTNIRILLDHLGNPQESFSSVHIAGTNGKGTTAHLLAACCQAQGLKVGLYTSPHYRDYRERVKINGQLVDEQLVIDFVEGNRALFERVKPSFFEITVALAFYAFAQEEVDLAIVETGLGGRLDSTNILRKPLLCIITNISFDHQQFLGDTLPEIAGEKAGIIKPGVPVIIGQRHSETESVFLEKAKAVDAPITFVEEECSVRIIQSSLEGTSFWVAGEDPAAVKTPLYGRFQRQNIGTALYAFHRLCHRFESLTWDWEKIQSALLHLRQLTSYKGRMQLLQKHPVVLVDSAHNEAGWEQLRDFLQAQTYDKLHLVLGMVKEKPPALMLAYFPQEASYYFCRPDVPRGLDANILAQEANKLEREGKAYPSVQAALDAAVTHARTNDFIFVGGSTFVLAELI